MSSLWLFHAFVVCRTTIVTAKFYDKLYASVTSFGFEFACLTCCCIDTAEV